MLLTQKTALPCIAIEPLLLKITYKENGLKMNPLKKLITGSRIINRTARNTCD